MNNFLKNIGLFIIGYMLINFVFYSFVTKSAVFENYIFNDDKIEEYNLFLLSDSHAACMQGLPNQYGMYNFSHRGDNYLDMYLKMVYLSTKLTSQDTVLLSIDDHILSSYRNNSSSIKKNMIYADYDNSNLHPTDKTSSNFNYKKYLKYMPLLDVHFGTFYFDYFLAKKVTLYHSSFSDASEKTQNIKCKRRYETQYKNKKKSLKQESYLKKIIALCKKNNIPLIGVKFPISKRYWDMIKEHNYGTTAIFEENNLEVYDFHDLFFDRTDLFYDQDHLNVPGAKILCQEIKNRTSSK